MTQEYTITLPAIPAPLRWQGAPQRWALEGDAAFTATSGGKTDWFIDPEVSVRVHNAPALLFAAQAPCQLRARVTVEAEATFDAGVLTVRQSEDVWAKLCFERSPQGQLMIVSVVTKGVSDDCNSILVDGSTVYLRLSKLEQSYAFHYSLDGTAWNMVRYFSLGGQQDVEIGFLVQSPTGEGCTVRFSEIAYKPEKLLNLRSGE